jgi:hypothetical protein
VNGGEQRQSTFLSEPLTPDALQKSQAYEPSLNDRGRAMHYLLSRMDGSISIGALTDAVLQQFAGNFISRTTLRFVRFLTSKYS